MKNFLVFAASQLYADDDYDIPNPGGWDAFIEAFNTLEEAKAFIVGNVKGYAWFQIVDLSELKVVYDNDAYRKDYPAPRKEVLPIRFESLWELWSKGYINIGEYYFLNENNAWVELDPIVNLMTWEGHAKWRANLRAAIDRLTGSHQENES